MSKYTLNFNLGYFQAGDTTDAIVESNRWRTIDAQMAGLFAVLGNGVLTGWDFIVNDEDSLYISIGIGTGHINNVSVESTFIATVALTASTRNYIYAVSSSDSYYNKTVTFESKLSTTNDTTYLLLGYIETGAITDHPVIVDVNIDDRVYVSFKQQILNLIKDHRHIGGTLNPTKINLATDVQGFLREENIDDLDASFIGTGILPVDRIPQLDHLTKLTHVGILTHSQLDTFVQILSQDGVRLMGETSSVDLLKMILAVKHVYPTIDDYLINELAFIPGISPDDVVDQVNTTAVVDYRTSAEGGTHTITGTPADSTTTFTKKWDTESEFEEAVIDNLVIVGNSLKIATKESRAYIDDFEDVTDWETVVTNMSSVSTSFTIDTVLSGVTSGKVTVDTDDSEMVFILKKTFTAQDWSKYNKISFLLYCDTAKHGDIYFYVYDAVAGSQGSYTMILERNSPTIDRDTLAMGWREMVIDLSEYTRQNITSVGFYMSTSSGWSMEDSFSYNVDEMYLTSGNFFVDRGTAIFSYGNDFEYTFSTIRWDASVPDDTYVKVRTRVSDEPSMSGALWSDFLTSSGSSIILPGINTYKYIDVELTLETNYDGDSDKTPQLYALYLDCTVVSSDKSFEFSTKDSWDSGELLNVDSKSSPGDIKIKNITDLGTYLYSTTGVLKQLNSDMVDLLSVYGNNVPKSFVQMKNGTAAGFGQISAIAVGLRDSFFVADTDNDRVLEVDKNGQVLWGLMGTFPETPTNPYLTSTVTTETATTTAVTTEATTETVAATGVGTLGTSTTTQQSATESQSPVVQTTGTTTSTATEPVPPFYPLGAYYNVEDSKMFIMFNSDLENIYTSSNFNPTNMFLKAGARRVYFDKTKFTFSLFGLDESVYGHDTGSGKYLAGSNVLVVKFSEADAVTVSGVAASVDPYIVATSPKINEVITQDNFTAQFVVYNCTLGATGYGVRVSLDGGSSQDLRTLPQLEYTSLADGLHALQVNIIDSSGNILANAGCSALIKFYISTGIFAESAVSMISLSDNQVFPSGDISISFVTYNIPVGYYLRYVLDSNNYVQYDDPSPLEISGLSGGSHTLRVYISNSSNVVLVGDMTDVTISFVVGNRTNVAFTLAVGKGSVYSSLEGATIDSSVDVYVTPIRVANIYAPIDVGLILSDNTEGDVSQFNVLVAKMGTPSYLNYFGQSYADGHSVVEYTEVGALALSNNVAVIADTKENAKKFFGGASKYGGNEIFIADAYGKRAVVAELDTEKKTSSIVWQYDSDKVVSDFNRVPDAAAINYIRDSGIANDSLYSRRDLVVTWYNNTNETIRILSGETDYDQFYLDPDFDLFGSEFDSGDILPGQYYSFRFINIGTYNYFVYPFIYTGKIYVVETSITPSDTFIVVENDQNESSYLNRILKIDAWGNVQWSFGESFAALIKDAKPVSSTEVIIAV